MTTRRATSLAPTSDVRFWANSAIDAGSMTRCDPLVTTYCVPINRQVSERPLRKLIKNHESHFPPVTKLPEVLLILGEDKHVDKQVTTSGGKLRVKKVEGG